VFFSTFKSRDLIAPNIPKSLAQPALVGPFVESKFSMINQDRPGEKLNTFISANYGMSCAKLTTAVY